MQKWEYLLVDANMYPFGNKLISLYVNGEEQREWKQGFLHLFINELGDEGWELVALRHDSKYDQNSLIFKRPKVVKNLRKMPDYLAVETAATQTKEIPAVETAATQTKEIPAVETVATQTKEIPAVETATTQTKSTSVD